ncbi:MAG: hypothetical protein KC619_27805 [Myxococcales bacterium]|nr:hypothetical protein [Myxococcales bacterium]
MSERQPDGKMKRLSTLALVLAVSSPVLLAWSWSRPLEAPPIELPVLTLVPREVRAVRDADAALVAPTTERARTRLSIYEEANVAEHDATDYPGQARIRAGRLGMALTELVEEEGEAVIAACRASDTERAMRALHGDPEGGDAVAALGGFVRMMDRYDMRRDGRQTAPDFVVRTTFKARWNAAHGRDLTEGLAPIELQAYWGWLALHARSAPIERRLEALDAYEAAGGTDADEARGALLFESGDMAGAHEAFEAAYAEHGTFRLRNHALASHE